VHFAAKSAQSLETKKSTWFVYLCVGACVCVCIFVCLCCTLRPGSPAQNAGAAVPHRHTTHTHSPTYTHTCTLTHAHFPTHAQAQNSRLRQTTVKLGDGEEYQGQLSSNVPHGYGRAKFKSGCEYRGVWLNGQVRSWMYICLGWMCTSLSYSWFLRWSSQSDVLTLSHPTSHSLLTLVASANSSMALAFFRNLQLAQLLAMPRSTLESLMLVLNMGWEC